MAVFGRTVLIIALMGLASLNSKAQTSGASNQQQSLPQADQKSEFQAAQGGRSDFSNSQAGSVAVPASSGVYQVNAIAGFATNTSPATNVDGGYFQVRALSSETKIWGINPLVQDVPNVQRHLMIGSEIDLNVYGKPSRLEGLLVTGQSSLPLPITSKAVGISALGNHEWGTAVDLGDGSATVAINIGSRGKFGQQFSMPINFQSRDEAGTSHTAAIYSDQHGTLLLAAADGRAIDAPLVHIKRLEANLATRLTSQDFSLSKEWGSLATIASVEGTDQAWRIGILANGTGGTENPKLTLRFRDGRWTARPIFVCKQVGGSGQRFEIEGEDSVTLDELTLSLLGRPVSRKTYVISCVGIGQ